MEKTEQKLPSFDANLSPENVHNREAAKARRWRYDEKSRTYKDTDGALVADRFGQPY